MERPLLFQELGMTYDVQEESAVASATGNNGGVPKVKHLDAGMDFRPYEYSTMVHLGQN